LAQLKEILSELCHVKPSCFCWCFKGWVAWSDEIQIIGHRF